MIKIEVADVVSPAWTRIGRERLQVRVAKQLMRRAPLMNSTQRKHEKQEERVARLEVVTSKVVIGRGPMPYTQQKSRFETARFLLSP